MFCDGCGTALQAGKGFCSGCGKPIVGPVTALYSRQRVRDHIHLVAIFWFAISALNAIISAAAYIVANTVLMPGGPSGAPRFVHILVSAAAILIFGGATLGFLAGWGLMHREPWARPLALVLSFLVLFINIPLGTALGVYTMWVLLPGESEQEYETLAASRSAA